MANQSGRRRIRQKSVSIDRDCALDFSTSIPLRPASIPPRVPLDTTSHLFDPASRSFGYCFPSLRSRLPLLWIPLPSPAIPLPGETVPLRPATLPVPAPTTLLRPPTRPLPFFASRFPRPALRGAETVASFRGAAPGGRRTWPLGMIASLSGGMRWEKSGAAQTRPSLAKRALFGFFAEKVRLQSKKVSTGVKFGRNRSVLGVFGIGFCRGPERARAGWGPGAGQGAASLPNGRAFRG